MNNIKKLRQKHNILQTKLAYDLNLTQEAISSYETERVTPSAEILIKLSKYFYTSIDYILCLTEIELPIDKLIQDNLSQKTLSLISKFDNLREIDQSHVESYINFLETK